MRKNPEAPKGRKSYSLGREPQADVMRAKGKPQRGDRDSFAPLGLVSLDPGLTPWTIFVPPLWGFRILSHDPCLRGAFLINSQLPVPGNFVSGISSNDVIKIRR